MESQPRKIKTAQNVFTIIERVQELDEPTCSELGGHVDLSVSTIYNYLKTLEAEGYIIENDGRYRLSLRFLQIGRTIRNSYPIMRAANEPIDILAKSIDEYLSVFVREGYKSVMIHEANSYNAVETPTPFLGEPFDLVRSPQGKVLLTHVSEAAQREVISASELDESSIEELHADLETIRTDGIIVDDGQTHKNIWAVAGPLTVDGTLHGALMISTVRHRLDQDRARQQLPDLLRQTIKEVEHRLSVYDFTDAYSTW